MSAANAFYMKVAGLCFVVRSIVAMVAREALPCSELLAMPVSGHVLHRLEGAWRDS